METVRQYALEKLSESGEADDVRDRHRDHYTAMAALLDDATNSGHQLRIEHTETEIDNLRAAFAWSREHADIQDGLRLVSSLQPLWLSRGRRILEGLTWFYAILKHRALHQRLRTEAIHGAHTIPQRRGTRRNRRRPTVLGEDLGPLVNHQGRDILPRGLTDSPGV
jgi:hypothetical protein